MNFFRLSSRLVRQKPPDMERSLLKNPIKDAREAQLRSVLDPSPLRLARVRKGYAKSLKLKFFQRALQHLGWSLNHLTQTLRKTRILASNYIRVVKPEVMRWLPSRRYQRKGG